MGRHARRIQFSGYLVFRPSNPIYEYTSQREALYQALEQDDAGTLVHPVFCPSGWQAACERFSMIENRDRGGYTQFEMQFVEAGKSVSAFGVSIDTVANVASMAAAASNVGITNFGLITGIVQTTITGVLAGQ